MENSESSDKPLDQRVLDMFWCMMRYSDTVVSVNHAYYLMGYNSIYPQDRLFNSIGFLFINQQAIEVCFVMDRIVQELKDLNVPEELFMVPLANAKILN